MGKSLKQEKTKTFLELRVYIAGDLVKKLQHEAIAEKRTNGKQLEMILEKYYQQKGLSND